MLGPYPFGTPVQAREAHGGWLRRRVQPGERGFVLDSDVDGVRCRVRWPGGRTTTAYPWHITVLRGQVHVYDTVDVVVLRPGAASGSLPTSLSRSARST